MVNAVKLPEFKGHYDVAEAELIVNEVNEGNPFARTLFREAFMHTDLPKAFNQSSNAALIDQFPEQEPQHGQFTRPTTLKDLTPQAYLEVWPSLDSLPQTEGGKPRVPGKAPLVGPNNEYPTITLDEASVDVKLDKYGLRLPLTIEMIINDQLEILANYPQALAIFLRQLEDFVVAEALINSDRNGALDSITRVTGNPLLTLEGLVTAVEQLQNIKVRGRRANLTDAALVVPRGLELRAKAIVSIQSWDDTVTEPGKTLKGVANPVYGMRVVVFDALEDVNLGPSAGVTWFLVANANQLRGRPSLAAARLRGRETPQTFISSPNALTPAGGAVDWKEGSFLNDSIEFKARHFFGAKLILDEGVLVSEPSVG